MKHLNNLQKVLLPVLLLLAGYLPSSAQLNGTYTIGGTSPNFVDVAAACSTLTSGGVSGPVVFNIRPGTYTSTSTNQIIIGVSGIGVTGTSATNTVTFQPDPANPGVIAITSPESGFTIALRDADYINIKNLPIANTNSSTPRVIVLEGAATNNRVEGCTITSTTTTTSSAARTGIYASTATAANNTVIGNTFNNGSYGIYISGSSTSVTTDGWVIDNNTFTGNYNYGIYAQYTNNLKVRGNTLAKTGAGTYNGIYPYYCYGKTEIRNNTITSTVTGTFYAIYGQYIIGTQANYGAITGNTITAATTTTCYGIYNNYGNFDSIANNTVNISSTSSGTIYPLYNYNSNGTLSVNNGYKMVTVNNTFNATTTSSATLNFYGAGYFKNSICDNNIISLKGGTGSSAFYTGLNYSDSCTFNGNNVYDSTNSSITIYSAYYGGSSGIIKKAQQNNNTLRFISNGSSMTQYMGYYADNMEVLNNTIYFRASSTMSSIYWGYYCNGMNFSNNDLTEISVNSYIYQYLGYYAQGAPSYINNNTMYYSVGTTYLYLMNAYYGNYAQYNNNKITGVANGTAYIYHYANYNLFGNNWEFKGNDIDFTTATTASTCYGMYNYGSGMSGQVIANNKIKQKGTSAVWYNYVYYMTDAKIYNNSIAITTNNTSYGMMYYYPKGNNEFYNNTINNSSTGANAYCLYYYNVGGTGGGMTTFRNNVFSRTSSSSSVAPLWMYSGDFYQGDYNNIYAPTTPLISVSTGLGAGTHNTINSWRVATAAVGNDRNSLTYNPGFISPATADVRPDPNNANSWSLQGRGVHIPGNSTDVNGTARSLVTSTGVPDIGAYEFTPAVPAPLCTIVPAAPITAPGTQYALFGQDTVLSITYAAGSTVPAASDLFVKQYTGVQPPDAFTTFNSTYMYFYDSIGTNTAGTYNYSIRNYYKDPWMGTMASETSLRLAKKTIPGVWAGFASAVSNANIVRNFIETSPTPSGLSNFGYYTGLDVANNAGAGLVASPTGTFCPGTFAVSVYVKNNGNNVINNVKLDWQQLTPTPGPVNTINITTPIPVNTGIPGSNQIAIPLGNFTIGNGPKLKLWTYQPNGVTDPVPLDDTSYITLHSAFTGTYIVDINNGPATDYTTIVEAVKDLNTYGLCGPTTFRIRGGTYTGKLDIGNVAGSSVVNRVTFMSDNGNAGYSYRCSRSVAEQRILLYIQKPVYRSL
jgi:parallel beta-helix repeat protein